ncbi:Fic family protein [Sulfitobacter mediterraneus]|nr:Fic family protein [Sulfitobacter mediterraneus]MBM1674580.1 Fic family protein [Sulfitobacter mediterraneus]QRD42098.1 Fic family protein [Sulfitobacter mediterraneus]
MDVTRLPHQSWMDLGEIISKAKHVANAPIDPDHATKMYNIFLAKGAAATTAIEGNTLTEEDVLKQVEGGLKLPDSQEYLQKETQNIIDACNGFVEDLRHSNPADCEVTVDFIRSLNLKALEGLDLEDGVVPGEIRRHSVVVAGYRGAPNEDCYYLLERMCEVVEEMLCSDNDEQSKFMKAIFAALFSHVYIALIHPFGDGNGRTSRLLEVYILLRAGFPMPTCQLLSNHYNKTRTEYYRKLDAISKKGELMEFNSYALQGFVDGLREQVEQIQLEQVRVTWVNYVHAEFADKTTEAAKRQRNLALAISRSNELRRIQDVLAADLEMGRTYAQLAVKTLTRDINVLVDMELIRRTPRKRVRPNIEKITSFLPWKNDVDDEA